MKIEKNNHHKSTKMYCGRVDFSIRALFLLIFINHKCLINAAKAKSREVSSSDNDLVKELKQLNSDYGQEKFEVS